MPELKDLIERLGAEGMTNWRVPSTPSAAWARSAEPYAFSVGHINTRWGVVGAYQQGGDYPLTILNIVVAGRNISASWRQQFTERYVKTLANRFAREVAFRMEQQP